VPWGLKAERITKKTNSIHPWTGTGGLTNRGRATEKEGTLLKSYEKGGPPQKNNAEISCFRTNDGSESGCEYQFNDLPETTQIKRGEQGTMKLRNISVC